MEPELFKEFCEEFTRAVNRERMEVRASQNAQQVELKKIERELEKLMQLYLNDAMPLDMVKESSGKLEARKNTIEATLARAEEPPPLLHPSLAEVYRAKVTALHEALASDETRAAAAEILRSMVCAITLMPENGELTINLRAT